MAQEPRCHYQVVKAPETARQAAEQFLSSRPRRPQDAVHVRILVSGEGVLPFFSPRAKGHHLTATEALRYADASATRLSSQLTHCQYRRRQRILVKAATCAGFQTSFSSH